jgi:hypothetical protein
MKFWGFTSATLVLASAAWGATTLPTSLDRPPPGTIPNTKSCVGLGAANELARYRSGLGCLLGNTTLAALSTEGVNEAWARSVDATAFELARYGSTVNPNEPEALYIVAAKIDLAGVTPTASPALKLTSCAAASNATEEACVAYFCASTDALRVQSAELGALVSKVGATCGAPPQCLLKDLDVKRDTCHDAWIEKQRVLSSLIRARQDISSGSYTKEAVAAVTQWTVSADRLADQVRESALRNDYDALPALLKDTDKVAAPALLSVETERTAQLQSKLATMIAEQKQTAATGCSGENAAACKLERQTATAKVSHLKDTVKFQELKLDQAKAAADPKARVKILQTAAGP